MESPIGVLTLVATDGALSGVYLPGQTVPAGPHVDAESMEAAEQLGEYFAGLREDFTIRTSPTGTPFQRKVWDVLTTIPYGQTWTYTQLAEKVGRPDRLRAVAAAVGRNPLAIVVPCHRVIGSDGTLVGYSGGLPRKRFLLDLESAGQRL
jgi:methylated-DNA-[protein]-cysteine S-methyltransferase